MVCYFLLNVKTKPCQTGSASYRFKINYVCFILLTLIKVALYRAKLRLKLQWEGHGSAKFRKLWNFGHLIYNI